MTFRANLHGDREAVDGEVLCDACSYHTPIVFWGGLLVDRSEIQGDRAVVRGHLRGDVDRVNKIGGMAVVGRARGGWALALCVVLALALQVMGAADYYKTLGLSRGASEDQIKRAYRKLALKYHPDKNSPGDTEASGKFAAIGNAYEVLSNEEKRQIYDQHGEEGVKQHAAQGGGGGRQQQNDMFSQFFGGGFGGGGFGQQEAGAFTAPLFSPS